jgi:hypothetical protein
MRRCVARELLVYSIESQRLFLIEILEGFEHAYL